MAWVALWWLEQSPWAGLFHQHGDAGHHAHESFSTWMYAGAFMTGWLLMTIAMMLPTTVTLTNLFRRMAARHADAWLLVALLLAGYLTAWLAFGTLALALTWAANRLLPAGSTWMWGPGLILLAGAFQFSSVKYACLDKCRSPLGFLAGRWRGRTRRHESFAIGWTHGLFCVGCCWALMMLMFAVSTASLGWMLLLAVIMAAEKNAPWGRRMSRPLGYVLLTTGAGWGLYSLFNLF
jgi:predicted metal-binding membrane protein